MHIVFVRSPHIPGGDAWLRPCVSGARGSDRQRGPAEAARMIRCLGRAVAHQGSQRPGAGSEQEASAARFARLTGALFWAVVILYAAGFSLLSVREYDAFIPHALDLGNMAQTFWNTVHGHPFKFQNMRANVAVEAFGTNTRLSFHVEPIIPVLALAYLLWQHVQILLILQSVAIASGALPIRLFARRRLGPGLPEVVFPVAYLLLPALEAANLYEFHPVAFAAPLLAWVYYLAETRRYTLCALVAIAAMGCKEEIGVLVALVGLWIALRQGERRFGAALAALALAWSFIALKVVVPHFEDGDSSYWARYLPSGWPGAGPAVTQNTVTGFWLHHPQLVWNNLTGEAKLSYLHRLLMPTGYLALGSPLILLAGLPDALLNLLSYEPHMYGGLAHYSAELAPVTVIAAIAGADWICRTFAPRLRLPRPRAVAICCLYVLAATLLNGRVNGFTLLATNFSYPAISDHDRLLERVLAIIPPNAAVSAQDNLNPHLSDREQVYLYPDLDYNRVQYILLDATIPTGPLLRPCDLAVQVAGDSAACSLVTGPAEPLPEKAAHTTTIRSSALLRDGRWSIVRAEDGILLLKRHQRGEPLTTTLPPAFFTFVQPPRSAQPTLRPIARFGDDLELDGYQVDRAERANLRNPDVVLTTWWRVLKPLPSGIRLFHYLSDNTGALRVFSDDQPATSWAPLSTWKPGQVYKVQSTQLNVTTDHSGAIDVDVALSANPIFYQDPGQNLPVTLLPTARGSEVVGAGRVLKLTTVAAHL